MDDLDSLVRRVDEDRWLASRFASAEVRKRLVTLYALNHEFARTAEVVSQPALGDIRLAWWRESIAEIYDGKPPRSQPALLALAAVKETWDRGAFEPLIEARRRDLDAHMFSGWTDLDAHIAATAGRIMRLAALACGGAIDEAMLRAASRAWGYVAWFRAGRRAPDGEAPSALLDRARDASVELQGKTFVADLFPALGYVALVPGYARALAAKRAAPPLLFRQWRLIAASATGRF